MKNQGNYINYSELHFTSNAEREKYLKLSKDYWTDDIFISLKQKGLLRKSVTKIWNVDGQAKLGILFEYCDKNAFERCEMEIRDLTRKHGFKFSMSVRTLRGIEIDEWTSETNRQTAYEEH